MIVLPPRELLVANERLYGVLSDVASSQEIHGEIPRDPSHPGCKALAFSESANLLKTLYECFLGEVFGIGGVAHRAETDREDLSDAELDQFAVCRSVARSAPNNQLFFTENVQSGAPIFRSIIMTNSARIFCQKSGGLESFFPNRITFGAIYP